MTEPELLEKLKLIDSRGASIIKLRCGIGKENRPHTLAEVGTMYWISRERVRQLELRAIKKLAALGVTPTDWQGIRLRRHDRDSEAGGLTTVQETAFKNVISASDIMYIIKRLGFRKVDLSKFLGTTWACIDNWTTGRSSRTLGSGSRILKALKDFLKSCPESYIDVIRSEACESLPNGGLSAFLLKILKRDADKTKPYINTDESLPGLAAEYEQLLIRKRELENRLFKGIEQEYIPPDAANPSTAYQEFIIPPSPIVYPRPKYHKGKGPMYFKGRVQPGSTREKVLRLIKSEPATPWNARMVFDRIPTHKSIGVATVNLVEMARRGLIQKVGRGIYKAV